jgi:sec-independent protein translocase protein TatA
MSFMAPSLAVFGFGVGEMVLVFLIIVLLFGTKKLPMLARGIGTGIRNFKGELRAPPDDSERDEGDR